MLAIVVLLVVFTLVSAPFAQVLVLERARGRSGRALRPIPSNISNAKPIWSMVLWQLVQAASVAWMSKRSRVDFAGSGAGGTTWMFSDCGSGSFMHATRRMTATPRSTGAVSCACANTDRNAAWFRMPRRLGRFVCAVAPAEVTP